MQTVSGTKGVGANGHDGNGGYAAEKSTWATKKGLAQMLKGGVIMDVVTPEQAQIAEDAGAVAVMALERVPSDIRKDGGVARMSPPELVAAIKESTTIPVMAKARIGHFVEAQVLETLNIDYIDESEVLTPADDRFHINKHDFKIPFVCGARDLGEALRRITSEIRRLTLLDDAELATAAKEHQAPLDVVRQVAETGRLPVVLFCAGGIATPADASLMMQLGAEGVFVGSGIFKSANPSKTAKAIVQATTNYRDAALIAEVSKGLGDPMKGIEIGTIAEGSLLATRGW